MAATVGVGFTVIENCCAVPLHVNPLIVAEGVTVIWATEIEVLVLVPVNEGIFPFPLAARPIVVFEFTHENVVPDTVPEKLIWVVLSLLQIDWLATEFTVGEGLTEIEKSWLFPEQVTPLLV